MAIEGSGVAIGVLPHLTQLLHDGVLCAPFGRDAIANRGTFFMVLRRDVAELDFVKEFVAWLRSEVRRDSDLALATPREAQRSPGRRAQERRAHAPEHAAGTPVSGCQVGHGKSEAGAVPSRVSEPTHLTTRQYS